MRAAVRILPPVLRPRRATFRAAAADIVRPPRLLGVVATPVVEAEGIIETYTC